MNTPPRNDAENPEVQKRDTLLFNDGSRVHIKIHDPSELGFSSQDIGMEPIRNPSGMLEKPSFRPSFRPSRIETSQLWDVSERGLSEFEP